MLPRGSGILCHITSLPSPCGIGDLGPQAYRFADLLRDAAQTYWQVLPLNPTQLQNHNSPYFSSSSRAGNPLLISPEKLFEAGLLDAIDCPRTFPENEVDFPAVIACKYQLLETAYCRFRTRNETSSFDRFCQSEAGWLDDFALFMALKKRFNDESWSRWPELFKRRETATMKRFVKECREEIARQKWLQYVFFEQWGSLKRYCNDRSIRIIGDIPIYISYDSADVWSNPVLFKLNDRLEPTAVSGVPPDYFSKTGQLWNNPVYNWNVHESNGFSWWIGRIKKMLDRFDILRIDHFRGLVQYWEIPAGATSAVNGSWRPVPTYELFDALVKQIPGLPVIAEDLGIITDDVRKAIAHYGFPGMKVLLFAFSDDEPSHPYLPHRYERNCVVYTGTHDNNTVRGWYEEEADAEIRDRFFRYAEMDDHRTSSVVNGMIRLALESAADCVIIPMQDYLNLGASSRMNRPAIPEGNWKWRMTTEQMQTLPVREMAEMAVRCGRTP